MKNLIILLLLCVLMIETTSASGQEGQDISNDYYESSIIPNEFSIPIEYNVGSTENDKLHNLSMRVSNYSTSIPLLESIDRIEIDSSFFQDILIISNDQISTYYNESNDIDNDYCIITEIAIQNDNTLDIKITNNGTDSVGSTFNIDGTFNIKIFSIGEVNYYSLYLVGYNLDSVPLKEVVEYDSSLRLNIPPCIVIDLYSPTENILQSLPEKTYYQNQIIYLGYYLAKTNSCNINFNWTFGDETFDNYSNAYESPNIGKELQDLGPISISAEVEDDLGNIATDQITIEVIKNDPPSTSELLYPEDGSNFDMNSDFFCWNPAVDPENGKIIYEIQISETTDFENIVNQNSDRFIPISSVLYLSILLLISKKKKNILSLIGLVILLLCITGCPIPTINELVYPEDSIIYSFLGLNNDTQYYWRVIARDEFNNSSTSEVYNFTTK